MKTRILIFLSCFMVAKLFAQEQTSITLLSENTHSSKIKIHCGTLQRKSVVTSRGESLTLTIDKGHSWMVKGAPNLPSLSFSVQLPAHASGRVEIIEANYDEVNTTLITPSKGNITRDLNPGSIPFTFGPEYHQNQFYPTAISAIQTPYIFRDFADQSIQIFPVQYNPY